MELIYLDASALNRVFDDQSQSKIYLQSSAMIIIFQLIQEGMIEIASSDILQFENSKNPYLERKTFVNFILSKAKLYQKINEDILNRARQIKALGIKDLDALHLASAEKLQCTHFITCDERIIKRYNGQLAVMDPVDYIKNIMKGDKNGN